MSTTPYKTPTRRPLAHRQPQSGKSTMKAKAVDVVTGKTIVEYFFDPTLVITNDEYSLETTYKTPSSKNLAKGMQSDDDMLYSSKHLFMPCTIVKRLEEDKESNGAKSANTEPYDGPTLTKTADGALHKISDSSKLIPLSAPDDYVGEEDVLHLPHVTEASLLHTLRVRYKRDDIYTSAGPILISVNPYKTIITPDGESLYSENHMMQYRSKGSFNEKPPHLFQVADRAYTSLMDSIHSSMDVEHLEDEDAVMLTEHHAPGRVKNQSIIISGESGAGKTEATKFIMQYLARITKRPTSANPNPLLSPDGKQMIAALEDRVLSSNPLLETFGNAQTLRNDNSSRFGKFIHIYFSTTTGTITAASISNYLLEKTRITAQVEGERNYHIFYQLLAGADPAMLKEFGIEQGSESFNYLGHRVSSSLTADDAADFARTRECLSQVGLCEEEQKILFGMVAGVLHLGNVQFEETGEDGEPGNSEHARIKEASLPSLKKTCELLGLKEDEVIDAILTKNLNVNGKTIKKAQTVAMAAEKRDALAKMTYSCIFLWLVTSVNETLDVASGTTSAQARHNSEPLPSGVSSRDCRKNWASVKCSPIDGCTDLSSVFIGVLDIYGFESFEENGFEQLLINYCNEKMQRHFNRHLFEVEQALYANEGVDWTYISFNDNRPCLELIEGGRGSVGVLNYLDDAWGGMGNSSEEKDIKFVNQLKKAFSLPSKDENKNEEYDAARNYFLAPKFGNDRQFIIVHFAGKVTYTAHGFVEKNMETLSTELRELGYESPVPLAQSVYTSAVGGMDGLGSGSPKRSSIRGVSVGSQFRASLQSLVSDLESTQPHYIRCIKPNLTKSPNAFSSGEVLKQLRYSGMMEAIRIRREGYTLREEHESFYNRFSVLLSQEDLVKNGAGIENLVKILSKRLSVTNADWQIGHSKIFLRRELSDKLEKLAKLRVHAAARTVGRFGKTVARRRAASLLIHWARFRLLMRNLYRQLNGANKIISLCRGSVQRKKYGTFRAAVILVQAQQRRIIACNVVRKVRDPYIDMTFKDMQRLLAEEKSRLDKAVGKKDFKSAAELEAEIGNISEAMEAKRPLTRAVLEERIGTLQQKLADALSRKEYAECEPLQQQIDGLAQKREELPTIKELREAVGSAEDAVAVAASKRDFSGAAMGQARLDAAKARLAEALAAAGGLHSDVEPTNCGKGPEADVSADGIESRADLEKSITTLRLEVEQAIASKDFKKASTVQESLDAKVKLRILFPTIDELENELKTKRDQQEEAISKKDFATAGQLDEMIGCLEGRLKKEEERVVAAGVQLGTPQEASIVDIDGSMKAFESRHELEAEISKTTRLVEGAVSSKQFQKAEEMNTLVEKLESMRKYLPTLAEMEEELQGKRREMEEVVKQKKFADAERISQSIDLLEKKLEKERKNQPKQAARVVQQTGLPTTVVPKIAKAKAKTIDSISVHSVPVVRGPSMNGDASSVHSVPVKPLGASNSQKSAGGTSRLVSKLRPKTPVICASTDNIQSVSQVLLSKRSDASLVVDKRGGLAGILTDVDITRRVVAKKLPPAATNVSAVMTPNPTCVSMSDSAMDALNIMIENHFRHLPVVDDSGAVVGLLDIAKCLHEAISKLEQSERRSNNDASDVVNKVLGNRGSGDAHALQALLSQVMSQALGNQPSPTLGSLLAGKPLTIVQPGSSVQEAGMLMAEHRKAALVVENGKLVGIFGFKDMMTRVVAKGLLPDRTPVSRVMTENPEFVSPEMTVLGALQTMHDNKFLTLPVCDSNGKVLGIVDVISVIKACGGGNGWQSIFSSAMEIDDDASEAGSVNSSTSGIGKRMPQAPASKAVMSAVIESGDKRLVSMLRPKRPLTSRSKDSIRSVAQMLANKRSDATLVLAENGSLAGILTDVDITRRVVARKIDPNNTEAKSVMTPDPTCVSMTDSAMDALGTMIENHFRHLPVVDDRGSVVGLLDIAKCLHDAITKLEKTEAKTKSVAGDVMNQVLGQKGSSDAHALALQALLSQVMSQALGSQSLPTLGSLLAGRPPLTVVHPETSVQEAGMLMAEHRKAALVVENGKLVGIFGFKDMMTRVVAKGLPPETTPVSRVMTKKPEFVPSEMTVLEALQTMHDNSFLTLPVCSANSSVCGIVDVIDIINNCGGAKGWRSIFTSAMAIDDDASDAGSTTSFSSRNSRKVKVLKHKSNQGNIKVLSETGDERPVSKLRPRKPLTSSSDASVLSVSQMLSSKRGDAALILSDSGNLSGILTDVDITRRVVANSRDPVWTIVSDVMTPNPMCVSTTDSAMDALGTMIENHFRHLPVVDAGSGAVVGLLDIAKCLNDAISKLEKSETKSNNIAGDVVNKVLGNKGSSDAHALALQALLSQVMSQALGSKSLPTLGSLLAGKPPLTAVEPETSVQEAGMLMAEHRKAALVVENGKLAGIFGFKDMMTRVVAKGLPPDSTPVSRVMTENPEFVSPNMTVLEALQTMHDNKFLTLPVCDYDGSVMGIVDVFSVINACGGENGWRSILSSALELKDDDSDASSVNSFSSMNSHKKNPSAQLKSNNNSMSMLAESHEERPVSKLRPKKPMLSGSSDNVLAVVQMLASKRADASLVVDSDGTLAGIITDVDVTRRVVAKSVDPVLTCIADVMTRDPTCVSMTDSAMEAMATMVENRFRHLPVLDDEGGVVGVLDIAKCLTDAISKLEKSADKKHHAMDDVVKQVVNHGAGGAQATALHTLLSQVMAQVFGNQSSPTLGSLLAGVPPQTIVGPNTIVRDAGILMAAHRKAALVVEDGDLIGIFGFKDMMTRAVAKGLQLDSTPVSEVMTPNPESVSDSMTVLDAMQVMHDHRFLSLPVINAQGAVLGVVDVMDVILACGGKDGWRSIFSRTIELDDFSDGASMLSAESGLASVKVGIGVGKKKPSSSGTDDRTVARLRPKKPNLSTSHDSVLAVCQMLSSKRADASLVVDETGMLAGIVTAVDITRRVVAQSADPVLTKVSSIMTRDPVCVSTSDLAMDAMATMVENHFRHLPVLDDEGAVVGVLDIAKCLNDAISKLEKTVEKNSNAAEGVVKHVVSQGACGAQAAALQMLLSQVMAKAFGNQSSPSLGSLLVGTPPLTVVGPDTSVRDSGMLMAAHRKAALVLENGELIGIFGFNDMMTRAVAKGLSLDTTPVSAVMTPHPESVSGDMTVLEAMQVMHDHSFLTLPVCDSNNSVMGVVDIMDLIQSCGGKEGWRSIFSSAFDVGSVSDLASATQSKVTTPMTTLEEHRIVAPPLTPKARSPFPNNIPMTLEFEDGVDDTSTINDTRIESKSMLSFADGGAPVFKVVCPNGNTHRVRCDLQLSKLMDSLAEKGMSRALQLEFIDDEGDTIMVTSDDCLNEAAGISRTQGHKVIKLTAKTVEPKRDSKLLFLAGAGVVVAAGAAVAFFLGRPRK